MIVCLVKSDLSLKTAEAKSKESDRKLGALILEEIDLKDALGKDRNDCVVCREIQDLERIEIQDLEKLKLSSKHTVRRGQGQKLRI